MALLILYIIINITISIVLECKKVRSACVAHGVLSVFTLFILLLASEVPAVKICMKSIMTTDLYYTTRAAMDVGGVAMTVPMVVIELLLSLQLAAIISCLTAKIVDEVVAKRNVVRVFANPDEYDDGYNKAFYQRKLYCKFAVWLC